MIKARGELQHAEDLRVTGQSSPDARFQADLPLDMPHGARSRILFPPRRLYPFPMAVVTTDHVHGGFKQRPFIIWKSEVYGGPPGLSPSMRPKGE